MSERKVPQRSTILDKQLIRPKSEVNISFFISLFSISYMLTFFFLLSISLYIYI